MRQENVSYKCTHDATLGKVGDRYYYCLECKKKVYNPEWKEARKILNRLSRK